VKYVIGLEGNVTLDPTLGLYSLVASSVSLFES
jgi:hypothetical protein